MDAIWEVLFYAALAAIPGWAWLKVANAKGNDAVIDAVRTAALVTVLVIGLAFAAATLSALGMIGTGQDIALGR